MARLCKSIKIDIVAEVEGYQVQHNGRTSIISLWAAKGVNLDRFCRVEGINVSKGIITSMIRPAGRSDVTVSVNGLDFNTPDSLMKKAMSKINFSECRQKFFNRPLYCRPLRDITPEKIEESESTGKVSSPEKKTFPPLVHQTGTTPKNIPGLSPEEQAKVSSKQKKKERQRKIKEQKKKEEHENIESDKNQIRISVSAFDLMMKTRHLQNMVKDPRSGSGQELSRRMSFGSSPNLKRGAHELSSPSSPQTIRDLKKNKNIDSAASGEVNKFPESSL